MQKAIFSVLKYFAQFQYDPTQAEIYTFLPVKVLHEQLQRELKELVKRRKIRELRFKAAGIEIIGYTHETTIKTSTIQKRYLNSVEKRKKAQKFIAALSKFSSIQLIGISGSTAMNNASTEADVDLFIITRKNHMWTARFVALVLAGTMGIRRSRNETNASNKVCLNLFFDEQNMSLPPEKRSIYTAHEVLQMKPVFSRNNIYDAFLSENNWVKELFPNSNVSNKTRKVVITRENIWGTALEWVLKQVQLFFINRHRTTERITDTQLWFFPDDFEHKIR